MILIKIINYIRATIKKIIYKIVYSSKFNYGKKFYFRKGFILMIGKNATVNIGENCFFNNYCSVNALQNITIGNGTIFGENVRIYDHNHRFAKKNILIKNQGYSTSNIYIGDNCWIGSDVIILKGASIGDNCVIGAGCIINSIIPNNTIVRNNQIQEHKNIEERSE